MKGIRSGRVTEEAGGYSVGWSTLVLMNRGMWDEANCNLFPQTAKAVKNIEGPVSYKVVYTDGGHTVETRHFIHKAK